MTFASVDIRTIDLSDGTPSMQAASHRTVRNQISEVLGC